MEVGESRLTARGKKVELLFMAQEAVAVVLLVLPLAGVVARLVHGEVIVKANPLVVQPFPVNMGVVTAEMVA